jgi:hypothetical protein
LLDMSLNWREFLPSDSLAKCAYLHRGIPARSVEFVL